MNKILIDESYFGDKHLSMPSSPQPKINVKLNSVDLKILDELAKSHEDSRSQILNLFIENIVKDFITKEITSFDTKYFLATIADRMNPQVDKDKIEKSWVYEIDPEGQAQELANRYYQYDNAHTQEHEDIKLILKSYKDNLKHEK